MEQPIKAKKGWKIFRAIAMFAAAFVVNVIWSVIVTVIFTIFYAARGHNLANPQDLVDAMFAQPATLMFSSMYNIAAIGLVFLCWRFIDKRNVSELGFGFNKKNMQNALLGLLAAAVSIGLIILGGIAFGILSFDHFGAAIFGKTQLTGALIIGIFTFLMVGFGEEAVFRGYVQNQLTEVMGNKLGLLTAALIFMVAHLGTYAKILDFIDVFLAGLLLGYAYILTKSIYLPSMFHFLWDYLQLSIFRLQDYEYYTGPVLAVFQNSGDFIVNGFNLGNRLELIFIAVELLILCVLYGFRKRLRKMAP